jgi:phage anti-repressor protein
MHNCLRLVCIAGRTGSAHLFLDYETKYSSLLQSLAYSLTNKKNNHFHKHSHKKNQQIKFPLISRCLVVHLHAQLFNLVAEHE